MTLEGSGEAGGTGLPDHDPGAPGHQDGDVRTVVVQVGDAPRPPRIPRRTLLLGLGGAAVVVIVAIAALTLAGSAGGRHADGQGILASANGPSHQSFGRAARLTGPMTGAIRLCLARGTTPAVIQAIGPDHVVGSGWHFLGAMVRTFVPGPEHSTIVSIDGYPPALPDQLQAATGFSVTTPCGDVGNGPYTELLLGLEPVDAAGGGWDGIDVTYQVGGSTYVLVVGQAFVQCGTASLAAYCPGS